MNAKHTPGPWTYVPGTGTYDDLATGRECRAPRVMAPSPNGNSVLCELDTNANARRGIGGGKKEKENDAL